MKHIKRFENWFNRKFGWFFTNGRKFAMDPSRYTDMSIAYNRYRTVAGNVEEPDYSIHYEDPSQHCVRLLTYSEFYTAVKSNKDFIKRCEELSII